MTNHQPYLEQIKAYDPDLKIDSIRNDPDALTNDVFIVNESLVFRFPKNEDARAALGREARLLKNIWHFLYVEIPKYKRVADDFGVYDLVPGKPLYWHDLVRMSGSDQEKLAGQLGRFLWELHHIPQETVGEILGFSIQTERKAYYADFYENVRQQLYPLLWKDQKAYIEDLFAPVLDGKLVMDDFVPVLVHDDLASYHILCSDSKMEITGILDFGTAHWGDPADDFATLLGTYGEGFIRRMSSQYPGIESILPRARYKFAALELEWALKGLQNNDIAWFLVNIGRARDMYR